MVSIVEVYDVVDANGMILEFHEVTLVEYDTDYNMFDEDIFAEEDQERYEQTFWWDTDRLQPICVLPSIGGDM